MAVRITRREEAIHLGLKHVRQVLQAGTQVGDGLEYLLGQGARLVHPRVMLRLGELHGLAHLRPLQLGPSCSCACKFWTI